MQRERLNFSKSNLDPSDDDHQTAAALFLRRLLAAMLTQRLTPHRRRPHLPLPLLPLSQFPPHSPALSHRARVHDSRSSSSDQG